MRRRLFTLALFLLLSAVVNVVVAWASTVNAGCKKERIASLLPEKRLLLFEDLE